MTEQKHTSVTERTPLQGGRYRVVFQGEALYDGTIIRAEGCWARVRIDQPVPGKHEALYHVGDEYEIKTALYELIEIA